MAQQSTENNPIQKPNKFQRVLTALEENKRSDANKLLKERFGLIDKIRCAKEDGFPTNELQALTWDVNQSVPEKDNITLLHIGAQNGHEKAVRLLLDTNADPNAKALRNITPLHLASQNGHLKIVKLLINYHAEVDAKTTENATSLHVAASMGNLKVAIRLIDHGADIFAMTQFKDESLSVLDVAKRYNHPKVIAYLEEKISENNDQKKRPLPTTETDLENPFKRKKISQESYAKIQANLPSVALIKKTPAPTSENNVSQPLSPTVIPSPVSISSTSEEDDSTDSQSNTTFQMKSY